MLKKITSFISVLLVVILNSCGGGSGSDISEIQLYPVKSGSEYQYIDKTGKIVINPQFSEATVFRGGLALVKSSGENPKWGFISENAKYEITAQYKEATVFSDGLAWVVMANGAPTAINKNGETQFTLADAEKVRIFKNGLAAFCIEDEDGIKWGFIDKEGQIKINPQFSKVNDFSDGKCAVCNDEGKWGYIDNEGKIVINYQFDGAKSFIKGKSVVKSDGKHGLIDETGKYLINPQYTEMSDDGNIYLISQDGKHGWCDEDGVIVINPQFEEAYSFNGNDLAAIRSGKSWGYIDKEGKIKINPQFNKALPFNGNIAMISNSKKIGFIDTDGKYIINPQYSDVPIDLALYLLEGSSKYEIVETDFFDISAIISILDFENPEGLTYKSNFSDVIKKFNLKVEKDINIWSNEHKVISNKSINNDANYDFFILGYPRNENYDFDDQSKITGFAYRLSLSGNGYGKADALVSAIEETMGAYKKDDKLSSEQKLIYSGEGKTIDLRKNSLSSVVIIVTIVKKEIAQEVEDNKNQEVSNSENIEYYKIQDPDGYSNLRAKPDGEIVKKVFDSERFEVIETEGNYKKVKLADGTVGYIHKSRVVKNITNEAFYIVNVAAVKEKSIAQEKVKKLKDSGYNAGYLWIPDYESLSGAKYYSVYIGPFDTQYECEVATEDYRKIQSSAYGLLVSHDKKRVKIKGVGKVN